uniref:Uncharacterized protein n=1 Tax=Physcomitrium patens TaxID=3218 RepID=A0A7I3ZHI2_PHYPA
MYFLYEYLLLLLELGSLKSLRSIPSLFPSLFAYQSSSRFVLFDLIFLQSVFCGGTARAALRRHHGAELWREEGI